MQLINTVYMRNKGGHDEIVHDPFKMLQKITSCVVKTTGKGERV